MTDPLVLPYPTEKCRSCQAMVRWAADRNGDRVLLDVPALPVRSKAFDPRNGDVVLTEQPGHLPLARRVRSAAALFGKSEVWRRHITTCPDRKYWTQKAGMRHNEGRKR